MKKDEGRRKNYEGESIAECGMRNGTSEGTKCQRLRGQGEELKGEGKRKNYELGRPNRLK
jgi:hypothetical protein